MVGASRLLLSGDFSKGLSIARVQWSTGFNLSTPERKSNEYY
jgi:hypothetical protein